MNLDKAMNKLLWAKGLDEEESAARDIVLDEFQKLIVVAIETAFDKMNPYTETLMRRLLAIEKIKLKDGKYVRDELDFEKNWTIDGIRYEKEKMFFINDDKLDEYTRQLEKKVEEYEKNFGKNKN